MKNSIFRSYSKKILKSEAFISIIVVFVLALGIIGTSYALYMDVDTDTDYQLVEVGDLSIGFDNGENIINLTNMTPTEDEIALKSSDNVFSFYIYNTGTYIANYDIKLETLEANQVDTQYINYQFCKDNATNCGEVKTLSNNSIVYTDELAPKKENEQTNPSAYYFLRVWVNNQYPTTNTEGQTISLKVIIESKSASGYLDNNNTLAGAILNNPNITINNITPEFTGIADYKVTGDATSGEPGLYKAEDDYGISYYFRGAQSNNYVSFAGFIWRVVRINGDGSIRLILDGSLDKVTKDGVSVDTNTNLKTIDSDGLVPFKTTPYDDNAYIGYMFGTAGSSDYDTTHKNINDSTIKTYIDTFFEEYIKSYEKYLADTLFCGDKTRGKGYTTLGYGTNITYYGAFDRLYKSSTLSTPTLKCASLDEVVDTELTNEQLSYSRYTVNQTSVTNGTTTITVNDDLTYPIALLSADELVMAGAFKSAKNTSYYLYDAYGYETPTLYQYWWTMSPVNLNSNSANIFSSLATSNSINANSVEGTNGVRPVINLKADVLIDSGDGTSGSPYLIKYN